MTSTMMMTMARTALVGGLLLAGTAGAALPKPTPAQQQAAAEKKAKADAQAAKDKVTLALTMDAVAAHWRERAAKQGWQTHPAITVAAAPTGNAPAGQPQGQLTRAGASLDIKSEKLGTAPPSEDVKAHPTRALPAGAAPTVNRKDLPKVNQP